MINNKLLLSIFLMASPTAFAQTVSELYNQSTGLNNAPTVSINQYEQSTSFANVLEEQNNAIAETNANKNANEPPRMSAKMNYIGKTRERRYNSFDNNVYGVRNGGYQHLNRQFIAPIE